MKKQFHLLGIVAVLAVIFIIAGCGENQENPMSISNIEQQIKALGLESGVLEPVGTDVCASNVDDYNQGTLKNGNPIGAERSDPNNALGAVDGKFFSLGFNKNQDDTFQEEGGYIVVMFDDKYKGTVLTVWEETWGSYPEEKADVYISKNGSDWEFVGTATNKNSTANTRPSEFNIEGKCFQYVKIVDKTNPVIHSSTADAFDVNAICIKNAEKCQACEPLTTDLIAGQHTDVGSVTVWNSPDGSTLYVQYVVDSPWYLTEAHFWASIDWNDIPQNAAPGQFPYKEEFAEPYPTEYTFSITKEEGWDCGTQLYLAAHATVCAPGEGEPSTQFVQGIIATQTLWAGQNIDAGTVTVKVESENLVVTYETKDGWEMTETHLAVSETFDGIPQTKKGNSIPGQFPYKHENLGGVTVDSYTIPLSDFNIECGDMLYMAAHAALQKMLPGGGYQTETGWADGDDFPGNNWATYFTVTIECETIYPEPECETAWGYGDYTFIDYGIANKWGWFFDYTICCE